MGSMNIFDLLIIGSGIYLIYTAVNMKRTGKIAGGVMLSKDVDVNKIRDKKGYINYMYGKVILLGILTCVAGALGLISEKMNGPVYLPLIGVVCYLVILVLFAIAANKAKKMFIQ